MSRHTSFPRKLSRLQSPSLASIQVAARVPVGWGSIPPRGIESDTESK